jgi:ABC-type phosphate/phosphonate transport system ATPase subunit
MIELLGVGVRDAQNAWLVRRACARLQRGALSAVVSTSPRRSAALLDALTGRRIPDEGRVWVTRIPVMRETRDRVRALVAEATATAVFVPQRSVLWNTLVRRGSVLAGLLRLTHRAEQHAAMSALAAVGLDGRARDPLVALPPADRLRVAVARTLVRRPAALVLRDIDITLGPNAAASLLAVIRRLAQSHRLTTVVSLTSHDLARAHADAVFVLENDALVADRAKMLVHPVSGGATLAGVV